jgi:hypothetical protein
VRALFFLYILFGNLLWAADLCPAGTRFISFKGESSEPEVLLCEKTNPHEYVLLFSDGRQRIIPLFPLEGNKGIIEELELQNWDTVRLSHVKSLHQKNQENENRYYEVRQNYQSISVLDLINRNSENFGEVIGDPCANGLDFALFQDSERQKNLYSCQVVVNEADRVKLGLEKSGVLTLKEMKELLKNDEMQLISKSSVDSVASLHQSFRAQDFAEYELKIFKQAGVVHLEGTCRERRVLFSNLEQFTEEQRRPKEDSFVNPLDFKVNVTGMDVGFPFDVKMKNNGTQNREGEDQYDIDLNLGLSTDVNLGGGIMMNIEPSVQVPFARNVSGISDFNANNLTRDLIPTEVGVRFSLEF